MTEFDGFATVHPDRGGGPIDRELQSGMNTDKATYPEGSWIKCKKCGHVLNRARHPKGWGVGNTQQSTQLDGTVSAGDTTITVDSTTGFDDDGSAIIYDTGKINSNTDNRSDRFEYTGKTDTIFTGVTGVSFDHADDMYVREERKATGGCPFCGSFNYD